MLNYFSFKIRPSKLLSRLVFLTFLFPFLVRAQPTTFSGLVEEIVEIINVVIPGIFGLAFVYIMWKVIDAWVINGGDQAKRQEGKQLLLIGVLMFVLMIVTWGIVSLLRNAFFG